MDAALAEASLAQVRIGEGRGSVGGCGRGTGGGITGPGVDWRGGRGKQVWEETLQLEVTNLPFYYFYSY